MNSSFSSETYLRPLIRQFENNRNETMALKMKRYMKNKFTYYGIQQPLRKSIWKSFKHEYPLPSDLFSINNVVETLWNLEEREFQMVALDLLYESRKSWDEKQVFLLEKLIVSKSWWDTVDMLSSKMVGYYFQKFPKHIHSVVSNWNGNSNMWLNRSAILFQLKYKNETDFNLLKQIILNHSDSKEFFIQKAIGWSLREYAKSEPDTVLKFVQTHQLATLSKREALKHL